MVIFPNHRVGIAKLICLPILFLFIISNISLALKFQRPRVEPKLNDHGYIVGIGIVRDEIFCLGVILSATSILSMASCFEERKYNTKKLKSLSDDGDYDDDYDEEDDAGAVKEQEEEQFEGEVPTQSNHSENRPHHAPEGGKMRNRPQKRGNKTLESTHNDTSDYYTSSITDYDYNNDVTYSSSAKIATEHQHEKAKPMNYSLYRIDHGKKIFRRLSEMGSHVVKHPEYRKIEGADLWRNDAAIVFIKHGKLQFNKGYIRPIDMYVSDYGNYVKAQSEEMINSVNCQVIGLIEYSDNNPYTGRDTDVELVAQTVLVEYDECNSTVCSKEDCRDTGHHIFKRPPTLLPYFVRGSPLVCAEQVLSVVNIHSHCDDRKYSAEFPSPRSVRFFLKNRLVSRQGLMNHTLTSLPRAGWLKAAGPHAARMIGYQNLVFGMIVNSISNQIVS